MLSLVGVSYAVFKDFFLTSVEQFEKAQLADNKKEFKKAEKYYVLSERAKES